MPATSPGRPSDLIQILAAGQGIVCLAGAGGKKSTIQRLASRLTGRVAITATVHTPPFSKRLAATSLVAPGEALPALLAAAPDSRAIAYACPSEKKARLSGVDPALISDLHASCGFDVTLVKADGARLRRIKAPGPLEPVLPGRCATLLYLVSVQAVGERLGPEVAHRPERLGELTGLAMGGRITAGHVADLLVHPQGGLQYAHHADCVIPVINMVDSEADRDTARLIANRVLEQAGAIDRVVLARMVAEDPVLEVVWR